MGILKRLMSAKFGEKGRTIRMIVITGFVVSALGAPAPILHFSNSRGFEMFTDLPFIGSLLLQTMVAGGVIFGSVLVAGIVAMGIGRGLRWMLA